MAGDPNSDSSSTISVWSWWQVARLTRPARSSHASTDSSSAPPRIADWLFYPTLALSSNRRKAHRRSVATTGLAENCLTAKIGSIGHAVKHAEQPERVDGWDHIVGGGIFSHAPGSPEYSIAGAVSFRPSSPVAYKQQRCTKSIWPSGACNPESASTDRTCRPRASKRSSAAPSPGERSDSFSAS